MTTALDIITLALKDAGVIGVGQTAAAEDANDALTRMNFMISEWQRSRWLVYHLVELSKITTGAQSYTLGPGGDFDTGANPRPDKLDMAYFRQLTTEPPNQVDYPLEPIFAREDYDRIALKMLGSFPQYYFYDTDFPLANVFVWPLPQAGIYEVHVTFKATLQSFPSLTTVINLPGEYYSALLYNLVLRLRAAYGVPVQQPDPVPTLAANALRIIRGANFQVPRMQVPSDLVRRGIYNPYSDQVT